MAANVFTELVPEVDRLVASGEFVWVEIHDPDDTLVDRLAEVFSLHPLSVVDLRQFGQRSRLEHFGDHLGGVFYGAQPDTGAPHMLEVHFFASEHWLVTVHRDPIPTLHDLRDRVIERGMPDPSMLLYKLFETLTESFFPALDRIDDAIDDVEAAILEGADQGQVERIIRLRRVLVDLRRVISPQRDMFTTGGDLLAEIPGSTPNRDEYFRDVRDHLIRVSEVIDAQRDLLAGAMDLYLSTVSFRQGEINKQLTLIATIFLPLTFITGFFGQNFGFMVADLIRGPASFWVFGVGSLVVSGLGLFWWFRRQGWA